jgi:collagen type XXI alpha
LCHHPLQSFFDEDWHQLKLLVRPRQVTGFLDDEEIQEVALLEPVEPIYINGKTQVAKKFGAETTVPVSRRNSVCSTANWQGM